MFYTLYSCFTEKSPTPRKKLRKKTFSIKLTKKVISCTGLTSKEKQPRMKDCLQIFYHKKSNPSRGIAFKEVARLEGVEPPTF